MLPLCAPPKYVRNRVRRELRWHRLSQPEGNTVLACAVVQNFFTPNPLSAPIVVGPTSDLSIILTVPDDLPPGSYPVALVCGDRTGISIRRDMVDLNLK